MTKIQKIVGIDPGKTVGLCLYKNDEFIKGQEASTVEEVIHFIKINEPDHVVVEDFIISSRPSCAKIPTEQIGAIKYFCKREMIPLTMQLPSALAFGSSRVKGIHKSAHIKSACSHVIYHIYKQKQQQQQQRHSCNSKNRSAQSNNKPEVAGVHWDRSYQRWRAQINVAGKRKHLGRFIEFIDAVKARWEAEKKYGYPDRSPAFNYLQKLKEASREED